MKNIAKLAVAYKMAILIGALFSINALSTAIVASFMNTDWAQLNTTSKFLLVIVVLQNWTGTMLAFFNKTLSRVEQGKFPIDTGDTDPQAFVKTTTTTEVKNQNEKTNPSPVG